MKDFLYYVAADIIGKYGNQLADIAIVCPNKRASLFLNEHLLRLSAGPMWSPAYITISELFRQQTTLTAADPIKLVCDLHRSFCLQTGSIETLDKFYGWGQLLVSDFDDIDKNMADADRVFANLRDIHEMDDTSYLTPEQRDILRQFFSTFSDDHNSELRERFLRLWSHLADIYHDFNQRLSAQGLAYEGALYRRVVEQLNDDDDVVADRFPYRHYLFVGFNLMQKVEQRLCALLQRIGKARFYWDFDRYYMQGHEAGQHIALYLPHFPNELDSHAPDIYDNFRHPKQLTFMTAPTENIQARYISNWLRETTADGRMPRIESGRRTAIVLCDEKLLATVIHCLPDEVDKVNVTTGYPLSQTPVAAFIQLYFNLLTGGRSPRLVRALQRHPYTKHIDEATLRSLTTDGPADGLTLTQRLLDLLHTIATAKGREAADPLFQESLFRAYTLVNRLHELIAAGDLTVDAVTLQRLTAQLVQQTSIPFHGEPVAGLQVMGMLETRNLDFDHVLLLSCNEGNLPRGVNDGSFIPNSIRRAYELTTVDRKVSIYAYYFHRLLQRAADVTILWNSSTEDGRRGEMSRFMLQLLAESGQPIAQQALESGQQLVRRQPPVISKSPRVMQVLDSLWGGPDQVLSPTAINRYMRCPLQFYYRYVADIKEPDTPDDEQELDNRIFGNIFHEAADMIYKQLPRDLTRDVLQHLLQTKGTIERAVDEAFRQELPYAPVSGLTLINREVIIHYLRQLITIDCRLAPFTILGLECDVQRTLKLAEGLSPDRVTIGGRIDRLDRMNDGRIRVVDYKTGGRRLTPLPDLEAIFDPSQIHNHSDYYLQTFVYADIVSRQHSEPVSPALLFIQHAAGTDYDPTLCFGRQPIHDVADHSARFNELLEAKVSEMLSPATPFMPTGDTRTCQSCPYARLCRQ